MKNCLKAKRELRQNVHIIQTKQSHVHLKGHLDPENSP